MELTGTILKGIGGFYYVDTADGVIECKARGKFRKTVGKPVVGDHVTVGMQPDGTGYLMEIAARRNQLIRPALANIDLLVAVASAAPPVTDPFLIDKVIAIAENKGIEPLVVVNKTDLNDGAELIAAYTLAGITVLPVSAETGEGVDKLRTMLMDKTSAFAGNSGVGKSSLLNRLLPDFGAEVGAISDRIGRDGIRRAILNWYRLRADIWQIHRGFLRLIQNRWILCCAKTCSTHFANLHLISACAGLQAAPM